MMKFVLIGAALVAAVCAAPADNKPGQQQGGRTDGLDQAESAWNNPNAWNAQSTWNRDPATWNHPNAWNHQAAWNQPAAWNRGYTNRNELTTVTTPLTVGPPEPTRGTAGELLELPELPAPVPDGTAGLDAVLPPDGQRVPPPRAVGMPGKSALVSYACRFPI
uniref:Secreted protein n=1 Tax=Anopheles atroparvus TaxID=41427 RepID=A0A182JH11_ANOAO